MYFHVSLDLGHKIDAESLHPLTDKIKAIMNALRPQNVHKLKSYLGLLSYYCKFMSNWQLFSRHFIERILVGRRKRHSKFFQ